MKNIKSLLVGAGIQTFRNMNSEVFSYMLCAVVGCLCFSVFWKKYSLIVRIISSIAFVSAIITTFIYFNSCCAKHDIFDDVSESVCVNTNLDPIVSWARQLLAQTNSLPDHGYVEIEKEKFPMQLNGFYKGPNEKGAFPRVFIYKKEGVSHYVEIAYLPGSTYIFGLFIGSKDFVFSFSGMNKVRKLEDGVYFTGSW